VAVEHCTFINNESDSPNIALHGAFRFQYKFLRRDEISLDFPRNGDILCREVSLHYSGWSHGSIPFRRHVADQLPVDPDASFGSQLSF
jgi:hypothetical protein